VNTTVSVKSPVSLARPSERPSPAAKPAPAATAASPGVRRRWLVALIVILGAAGVSAWQAYPRISRLWHATGEIAAANETGQRAGKAALGFAPTAEAVKDGKGASGASARVETVAVEVVQQNETLPLTGTLVADEKAAVASNVSGILAEVRVDRGSVVRKDDVLAQIDPVDAQNRLAEGRALVDELKVRLGLDQRPEPFDLEQQPEVKLAKAALGLAQANLRRAEELISKKALSVEAFDHARTETELAVQRYHQTQLQVRQSYQAYRTALTRLTILEKAVADTTIRAPFDGWVAEKRLTVGEQVIAGPMSTPIVTLVRVDPLRLSLTVPQQSIGHVRQGQKVHFHVDAFPDRTFEGTVRYITPVVTNDTRSMIVEAVVPNPQGELRPGVFATAQLELPKQKPEVFVPAGAVQRTGEVARVFVVRDGKAREQVVSLGAVRKGRIEVQSGLSGGERLVARPELVRDGDAVPQ